MIRKKLTRTSTSSKFLTTSPKLQSLLQVPQLTLDQQDVSKSFNFDAIFTDNDKQSEIYEQSAFSLVEQVVEGYNGTIFAYG